MRIILFCGVFVILVFLARTAALLLIYWKINGFISNLKLKLSDLFFKGYLNLPYIYHLKSDSAVMHNNLAKSMKLVKVQKIYFQLYLNYL